MEPESKSEPSPYKTNAQIWATAARKRNAHDRRRNIDNKKIGSLTFDDFERLEASRGRR